MAKQEVRHPGKYHFRHKMEPGKMYNATGLQNYEAHAAWVGVIVSLWSRLEQDLSFVYSALLGLQGDAADLSFYAITNHETHVKIITRYVKRLYGEHSIEARWDAIKKI
jgi:hypothetical protein